MFLKNAWYTAAWADEIKAGDTPLGRTIINEPVVIFRTREGILGALEDRCCHRHFPLSRGRVLDTSLQCGYHGFEFDASGACVRVPSQSLIPEGAKVRSFPVVERHRCVWIWMGEAARADEALIPDFAWFDDPRWGWKGALYPVRANYELIIENLTDLTHLAFVHASTIGNYALIDQADMKVERSDAGGGEVRVNRWMMNSEPPPTYVKAAGFKGKVDRWQIVRYTKPAYVRLYTGAMDAGAGAPERIRAGLCGPARGGGLGLFNYNLITPETDKTSHYFWAQGQDYRPDDRAATELVFAQVEIAFKQDWEVFEALQKNIDAKPDAPRVDVNGDIGSIQSIRMLRRAIEAENHPTPIALAVTRRREQ